MTSNFTLGLSRNHRLFLAVLAAASGALFLAGCNKNSETSASGAAKVRVGYIGLTCPRERNSQEFVRLRSDILEHLHLVGPAASFSVKPSDRSEFAPSARL